MSNLYIKLMSGEDRPDSDPYKQYRLLAVPVGTMLSFVQGAEPHLLVGDELITVNGNVYVMNSDGKTISTFTPTYDRPIEDGPTLPTELFDEIRIVSEKELKNTACYIQGNYTRGEFAGHILHLDEMDADSELARHLNLAIQYCPGMSVTFKFKNKRYFIWEHDLYQTLIIEIIQ